VKKPDQNIYTTQHTDYDRPDLHNPDERRQLQDMWNRKIRRSQRMRRWISVIVIVGTLLGVAGLVVFQQLQYSTFPRFLESVPIQKRRAEKQREIIVPESETLKDALQKTELKPIPDGEDIPFNTVWLKQAAHHVIRAEEAYENRQMEEALIEYEQALKIFPRLQGVHRYLGLIYLQLKDYPQAAASFRKAGDEDQLSHGLANNLGVSLMAMRNYAQAENYFIRALQIDPTYAVAYLNLATLYVRVDRPDDAAPLLQQYLTMKPTDIKAAQIFVDLLLVKEQWPEAIELLDKMRINAPDLAPVYFQLAQALSHTSRHQQALPLLEHGVTLMDPKQALARLSKPEFDLLRSNRRFKKLVEELGGIPPD
jgi:tetratricopeptide (TPR) repeat protein